MQKPDYSEYLADLRAIDAQKAQRQERYRRELEAWRTTQPTPAEEQASQHAAIAARLAKLKKDLAKLEQEHAVILANPSHEKNLRLALISKEAKYLRMHIRTIVRRLERENPALLNAIEAREEAMEMLAVLRQELADAQNTLSADELEHISWYQTKKARYIELAEQLSGGQTP